MITHEEARKLYKRLFDSYSGDFWAPFPTRSDLDTYRVYITQQEKKDKLLELYKELAKCLYYTDHDSLVKADNISGDILKIEEELK